MIKGALLGVSHSSLSEDWGCGLVHTDVMWLVQKFVGCVFALLAAVCCVGLFNWIPRATNHCITSVRLDIMPSTCTTV